MQSIIETFHIDWKIIIAQAVNFGVVFVVLYVYALKPLSKLMAERSQKIEKGVSDAKVNEQMLRDTKEKYEEILTKARLEADKIFQQGKKETEVEKTRMVEEAKNQVAGVIESGKKTLEAEKTKMVQDAKKDIISIAMLAAEKLTGAQKGAFDDKALKELRGL